MSLKAVKSLASSSTVAIISIRDSASVRDLPTFRGFRGVLRLDLLDVCEEHAHHAPGAWAGDRPKIAAEWQVLLEHGCRLHECRQALSTASISAVAW